MNLSEFYCITLHAFAEIEKKYFVSHTIKTNRICFKAQMFDMDVYWENFFEVNLNLSFYEGDELTIIPLKNIMLYLEFGNDQIEHITKNQFTSEQVYRTWAFETAKICDSVLECIFQNKKLLFSCSSWQNNVLQSSQHSAEIDAIKKNLNNFWKNKNYSEYLSYFLKYRQALANYPNLVIFERRAEYIRRHMVNN